MKRYVLFLVIISFFVSICCISSYSEQQSLSGIWRSNPIDIPLYQFGVSGNIIWFTQKLYPSNNRYIFRYDKTTGIYTQIQTQNGPLIFGMRYRFAVDSEGNIWIGKVEYDGYYHDFGVYKYDGSNILLFIQPNFIAVSNIVCDDENGIWLGNLSPRQGDTHSTRYDRTTGEVTFDTSGSWVGEVYVAGAIAWIKWNVDLLAIPHSLWYSGFSFPFDLPTYSGTIPALLCIQGITAVAGTNDGVTWFGNSTSPGYGVVRFDGTNWTQYTTTNGLLSNIVTSLAIDKQGSLWVGHSNGLSRFDGTSWETFTTLNSGLVNNNIVGIGVDNDGVVWFGCPNGITSFQYDTGVEDNTPLVVFMTNPYPNPFNSSTTIIITLPSASFSSLIVYNSLGQKIRELVSENLSAGNHNVVWDGKDSNGKLVSSGTYIARLKAGNYTASKTMMFMK